MATTRNTSGSICTPTERSRSTTRMASSAAMLASGSNSTQNRPIRRPPKRVFSSRNISAKITAFWICWGDLVMGPN